MTLRKKVFVFAGVAFLLLLMALIVAVPFLVDVDRHRPRIAAYIEEQTGKPARIGRLTLTIFPTLSVRVDDFVLGNPEGFPEGDFLRASRIYAELGLIELLRGRIGIQALEISDPVISLLSNTRGKWNFENPETPAESSAQSASPSDSEGEPSEPAFTLGVIERIAITGGQLTAAKLISPTETAPSYFEAANLAAELAQVDLNSFMDTEYTELRLAASGAFTSDSLRFGAFAVSSVAARIRLFPRQGSLDDLNFGLYQGDASGGLSFDFSGTNPSYDVAARLTGVDVAGLLDTFPSARGKMTGVMDGTFELNGVVTDSPGPLAGASGAGQLSIRDGTLPTLDLNRNLMRLARFTQLGPVAGDPSSFSRIESDFNIANQRITTEQLHVVGNGVEITAAGSIALAGAGNVGYEGTAKVDAGNNEVGNLIASLSGATFADGKLSFPFTLTGTLENPNFRLRSATPPNILRGLRNLFGGDR